MDPEQDVPEPDLEPLLEKATTSAVHLEMHDNCGPSDEPMYSQWRAGRPVAEIAGAYSEWTREVQRHAGRGVKFRRARIVAEPVTEYVRFLYAIAETTIAANEQLRWLPRRRASDLALPGNDFWLIDGRVVLFWFFSGDGLLLGHEITTDPAVVKLCVSAFEAVWDRAVPHEEYTPCCELT